MLAVNCSRHAREVLLSSGNIRAIEGSGPDLTIHWVCWCGHQGVLRPHATPTVDKVAEPTLSAAC
jgi:hypothetical protein